MSLPRRPDLLLVGVDEKTSSSSKSKMSSKSSCCWPNLVPPRLDDSDVVLGFLLPLDAALVVGVVSEVVLLLCGAGVLDRLASGVPYVEFGGVTKEVLLAEMLLARKLAKSCPL